MNTYVPMEAKFVGMMRRGVRLDDYSKSRSAFGTDITKWNFTYDDSIVFLQDDKQVYAVWSKPRHVVTYPDLDTALTAVTLKS